MVTLYDVPADVLIGELADRLADRIEEPDWAGYTKTGEGRELPPEDEDFWYVRAGSLLRKVATDGPIGVDRLSTVYGSKKAGSTRYRVASETSTAGGKKIIRTILQQLEEEDLVETAQGEGRRITPAGRSFLDDAAKAAFDDLDRADLERYA